MNNTGWFVRNQRNTVNEKHYFCRALGRVLTPGVFPGCFICFLPLEGIVIAFKNKLNNPIIHHTDGSTPKFYFHRMLLLQRQTSQT